MGAKREPILTDVLFIVLGVVGVAVAVARLGNNIEYPPNDVRSQLWFDPLVSSIMVLFSMFFFIVGAIRLLQGLRERNKQG